LASLFPDQYAKLVELLVAARKKSGVTQIDLAKSLRRPQSFVSKFETGERRLDPIEFIRIAQIISADPWALLVKAAQRKP
jgi:transcriptional regulator with XRE-family HTH domain